MNKEEKLKKKKTKTEGEITVHLLIVQCELQQ